MRSRLQDSGGLVAALAVASVLRVLQFDGEALWLDECQTAIFAAASLADMFTAAAADIQPPLYFALVHGCIEVLGFSAVSVRLVSLGAGLALVVAVWGMARSLLSRRAADVAALLVAISPMAIHYSQEGRNYALFGLLLVLAFWLADVVNHKPGLTAPALLSLVCIAIVYTHNLGPFFVAGVAAAFIVTTRPSRSCWGRWLVVTLCTLAAYSPWIPRILRQGGSVAESFWWGREVWERDFPFQILRSLAAFSHGAPAPVRCRVDVIGWVGWLSLAAALVCVGLALRGRGEARRPRTPLRLLIATLVPLALVFVWSMVGVSPVYVVGKSDNAVQALFLVLVAAGIPAGRRWVAFAVPAVFAVFAVGPLVEHWRVDFRSHEVAVINEMMAERAPNEVVIANTSIHCMLCYTDVAIGSTLKCYPDERYVHPDWVDWNRVAPGELQRQAGAVVEQAIGDSRAAAAERIWVMVVRDRSTAALFEALDRRLDLVHRRDYPGMDASVSCYRLQR